MRLLFGELDFDKQHDESQKALDSLQSYIAMAKTAGEAFDSIKQLLDDLSDVLHKSQLFRKDQEAKRGGLKGCFFSCSVALRQGLAEGKGATSDDAGGRKTAATGGEGGCLHNSELCFLWSFLRRSGRLRTSTGSSSKRRSEPGAWHSSSPGQPGSRH